MKNVVKPAAFAVAIALSVFSTAAFASGGPHQWYAAVASGLSNENSFSIEMNKKDNADVIAVSIQNPGRKNLFVTLSGPDGATIDNFSTGRKYASVTRDYNFTGAEEGMYTLVISDGKEKIKRLVKFERVIVKPLSKLIVQ